MLKRISFSSGGTSVLACLVVRRIFAKDGAIFSLGRVFYEKTNKPVKAFLKNFFLGHRSRSHDTVIRAYDAAGNVIETH